MWLFKILRQVPSVLLDYNRALANAATHTKQIGTIGHSVITGMIYSDQPLTLTISQGCNDRGGSFSYRDVTTIAVPATTLVKRQIDVVGKFAKAELSNTSGFPANVETFWVCRGVE